MAFPQGGLYCGLDSPEYQACRSARRPVKTKTKQQYNLLPFHLTSQHCLNGPLLLPLMNPVFPSGHLWCRLLNHRSIANQQS